MGATYAQVTQSSPRTYLQAAGFVWSQVVIQDEMSQMYDMFEKAYNKAMHRCHLSTEDIDEITQESEFWPEIENKLDIFNKFE